MIGAVLGAQVAVNLNERAMNLAIGIVMVVMLFMVIFNPKQWLRVTSDVQSGRPSI